MNVQARGQIVTYNWMIKEFLSERFNHVYIYYRCKFFLASGY